jgi:hypothetical protein
MNTRKFAPGKVVPTAVMPMETSKGADCSSGKRRNAYSSRSSSEGWAEKAETTVSGYCGLSFWRIHQGPVLYGAGRAGIEMGAESGEMICQLLPAPNTRQ